MFNFYKGEVARIDQWTILAPRTWARLIGSLSNDNGGVNKDGKKAIGLDWQNNNSALASRFFVHFLELPSLYLLRRKTSYFTIYGGWEHKI